MEEEKQDVIPESSPGEEVVETEETTPPAQEETPSTQEVKPEVKDSRPIENVAWETKRKLDELVPSIRSEIQELKTYITERQQPQTPTYSRAQLQAYASEPSTTTEQRLWAYNEVDKIEKSERAKEYENIVRRTQTQTQTESRKAQAAQWVANTFPDTIVKDQMGNMMGWNNQSPVLAKANEYMSRSESLRNDPDGFMAAVKMAAFDLGVAMGTNKKLDKTVGQLRKEQKKQLASAGGTRQHQSPENEKQGRYEKLKKQYSETGNKDVFAELLKIRGMNPFVT